jgi:excisionase family DNA binding protein
MGKQLTIGETAKRLGLEVDTVRKLERAGEIRAVRTSGGHRRFTEEEIDRCRRSRRKTGRAKAKPAKRRPVAPRRRHPGSGQLVNRSVEFESDLEDFEEGLPLGEDDLYLPPPPPTRAAPALPVPPPTTMKFAPRPAPATPVPVVDTDLSDRLRLQTIKGYGRLAIPWNTPAEWQGKVIVDLERFVTVVQFPADLSSTKAAEIVRARVEKVLRPFHEAEEKAKRDRKAKEESDRHRTALVTHGNGYARRETGDWGWSVRNDARAEVGRVLDREVEHDWTELEVKDAVDQVLDEWDEGQNEDEDDDDDDENDEEE